MLISYIAGAQTPPVFQYSDLPQSAYTLPKTFFKKELSWFGSIAAPLPSVNQSWNYGSYVVAGSSAFQFLNVREDYFPGANMRREGAADYIKGNFIPYDVYYNLDADGFKEMGRHYFEFGLDLEYVSGTPGDSLYIPEQNVSATPQPAYQLRYPQTYTDQYNYDVTYSVEGMVTFSLAGYDHLPFVKKTTEMYEVTAAGWGTAVVPAPGGVSEALPALLQRVKITVTDSFFVDGQPAPAPLLAFFGLPSGAAVTFSHTYLYHGRSFMPLLHFQHNDGDFGPVDNLYLIYDELGTTGVDEVAADPVMPFPNPCTDWLFVPVTEAGTFIKLYDLNGREIVSRYFPQAGLAELYIPSEIKSGLYLLQISDGRRVKIMLRR